MHAPSLALVLSLVPSLALVTMVLARPAQAWSSLGHEVAGTIAQTHLDSTARDRVRDLLGDEGLGEASTWADRMRSDPDPFWQETAGPYHYVTVPPGQRYADVGAPPQGDAVSALTGFRGDLCKPGASLDQKRLALRFSLHIIQDLHQPLHAGNGRDRGGNDVPVVVHGEESNLHRVWDRDILASAGLDREALAERLLERARAPNSSEGASGDEGPLTWIGESTRLRDRLYPPPEAIGSAYLRRWLPVVKERVTLAGLRSAAWINETFRACPASGAQHLREE